MDESEEEEQEKEGDYDNQSGPCRPSCLNRCCCTWALDSITAMELEYQATLVMILNIILPGVGTILSACFVENDPSNEHRVSLRSKLVVQGIL